MRLDQVPEAPYGRRMTDSEWRVFMSQGWVSPDRQAKLRELWLVGLPHPDYLKELSSGQINWITGKWHAAEKR